MINSGFMASLLGWIVLFSLTPKVHGANVWVDDYFPYIDQQSQHKGVASGVVVDAFKQVGVAVQLHFADWNTVENAIDNQQVFSFMWTKNKANMKKWFFSDVIYQQQYQLLARADFNLPNAKRFHHLHELRGIPIGLVQGYQYGDAIDQFRPKLTVTEYPSDYANLSGLMAGQHKLMIIDPVVAGYFWQLGFKNAGAVAPKIVESNFFNPVGYYLVCSKSYGNCLHSIKKFNEGLKALNQQGLVDAAFKRAMSF